MTADSAAFEGAVTKPKEACMSMFAYAMAFLPAVAVLTVAAFVVVDRRDGAALNDLRDLHSDVAALQEDTDALQSTAA
jgi:hypothetical protein